MQSQTTCPQCHGAGHTVDHPCQECDGQGRVPERQRVTIDIPAGIRDGQQLRLSGYGEAGIQGAPSGNLLVNIQIQPDEVFEREGDNLHVELSISMVTAALGGDVEIEGILDDEVVKVKVPEGCQPGQIVKVKGHGMPRYGDDSRGDLLVHMDVVVPKKLNKKQKELLTELAREMGEHVPETRSPLQKLRDIFD